MLEIHSNCILQNNWNILSWQQLFIVMNVIGILQSALQVALPAVGHNCYFTYLMIFRHNDHHGSGLSLPVFAIFWWCYNLVLQLIALALQSFSYKSPGQNFPFSYKDWQSLAIPTWLSHTWQDAYMQDIHIFTGLPSSASQCQNQPIYYVFFLKTWILLDTTCAS